VSHPWEFYDHLIDYAYSHQQIVEAIIGTTWTLCRSESGCGLAMSPPFVTRTLPWSGEIAGMPLYDLQRWVRHWQPHQAALGMAAINASLGLSGSMAHNSVLIDNDAPPNLAVFDHFRPLIQGKRSIVIGRYPGMEQRYREQFDYVVIERLNIHEQDCGEYPDPACEYLLPDADWVFLTGTSIINKTFPRLAQLASNAKLVLMGPSVPWMRELKEYGVDYLAGIEVVNEAALRQTVQEGGGTRIFDAGVRYRILDLDRV